MTTTTKIKTIAELEAAVRELKEDVIDTGEQYYHLHSGQTIDQVLILISQLKESWKEIELTDMEMEHVNQQWRPPQDLCRSCEKIWRKLKLLKSFGCQQVNADKRPRLGSVGEAEAGESEAGVQKEANLPSATIATQNPTGVSSRKSPEKKGDVKP